MLGLTDHIAKKISKVFKRLVLALACLFGLGHAGTVRAQQPIAPKPQTAKITWRVTVPTDTPASSKICIAGNIDPFGPWLPNAFEMTKQADGKYEASLEIPIGTLVEYKFTRGSWATVEKTQQGAEIQNRRLAVRGSETLNVSIASWAIPKAKPLSTATGDLRWIEFPSQVLRSKRRITLWLPPQYRSDLKSKFPVVYFLDGQNVFDNQRAAFGVEWQADETAKRFSQSPSDRPLILVAIDNSENRMDEYTSVEDKIAGKTAGGRADEYLRFLTTELKPWIDREYRTLDSPDSTALIGSSLGGLFVLYALHQHPDVFGKGAAMSPSLFWGQEQMLTLFSKPNTDSSISIKQRLWLDIGTLEGASAEGQSKAVAHTEQLAKLLKQNFPDRFTVQTQIESDAKHHEAAWARRLPNALEFLFHDPAKTESQ